MKAHHATFLILALAGCGGPSFGPDHPATPQQQAVAQSAERSLFTFTSDTMDPEALGGMVEATYLVVNASYVPPQMVIAPRLYAECAAVAANRVDFNCTINNTTLKGSVARSIGSGAVSWQVDLTETTAQTTGTTSINSSMHVGGSVKVSGGTQVDGGLSLNARIHIDNNGHATDVTLSGGVSPNHVMLDSTQHCATSGNIVVQMDASSGQANISQAVRYTFTGCEMITVAVSQ